MKNVQSCQLGDKIELSSTLILIKTQMVGIQWSISSGEERKLAWKFECRIK